jgi:hypothetical protein
MKTLLLLGLTLSAALFADLGEDLEEMFQANRGLRQELLRRQQENGELDIDLQLEVSNLQELYGARLKEIFNTHGWPTISEVGAEAARGAWLIAQNATDDLEFQERVLQALEPLIARGEANPNHYALLLDATRVAQGLPQIYGTQYRLVHTDEGSEVELRGPIEDLERLDERRAALGLAPHALYVEELRAQALNR